MTEAGLFFSASAMAVALALSFPCFQSGKWLQVVLSERVWVMGTICLKYKKYPACIVN